MKTRVGWILAAIVLALGIFLGSGCRKPERTGKDMPQRDIKTVMDAHAEHLMAIDGVVGVAIGETENATPCILIFVAEMTDELKAVLPRALEGHPVKVEVTGEFRPL